MQLYQQFDVDIVIRFAILGSGTGVFLKFFPIFADRIFIKSKMFSFEFRGIFHPEILLETRLRHR